MVKWEYRQVALPYNSSHITDDQLKELGDDGWELILKEGCRWIFKRPKQ